MSRPRAENEQVSPAFFSLQAACDSARNVARALLGSSPALALAAGSDTAGSGAAVVSVVAPSVRWGSKALQQAEHAQGSARKASERINKKRKSGLLW